VTAAGERADLALLVTAAPYSGREPRAELDIALAALALDQSLEVYFIGPAVLQLLTDRNPAQTLLPPGYSAWPALFEMGEVRLFAEPDWLHTCERLGLVLDDSIEGLDSEAMRNRWRASRQVLSV
jgi:sulfur relay (sulfurtransferase) DsrF/TusC family protein